MHHSYTRSVPLSNIPRRGFFQPCRQHRPFVAELRGRADLQQAHLLLEAHEHLGIRLSLDFLQRHAAAPVTPFVVAIGALARMFQVVRVAIMTLPAHALADAAEVALRQRERLGLVAGIANWPFALFGSAEEVSGIT